MKPYVGRVFRSRQSWAVTCSVSQTFGIVGFDSVQGREDVTASGGEPTPRLALLFLVLSVPVQNLTSRLDPIGNG